EKVKAKAERSEATAFGRVISSRLRLLVRFIRLERSVAFVLVFERQLLVEKVVNPDSRDNPLSKQSIRAPIRANPSLLHRKPVIEGLEKLLAFLPQIDSELLVLLFC